MATPDPAQKVQAAYDELKGRLRRLSVIDSVAQLLGWDEQVNLPPGAAAMRAEQHSVIADLSHSAASAPRVGELIAILEAARGSLDEGGKAVVRQARRDYDRATRLPPEFVAEKAVQSSRGYHAWAQARARNDFASYVPFLEANLDLCRREAAYLGKADAPYDVMLDNHDPGLTAAAVDRLFGELKRELLPFVRAVTGSKVRPKAGILRGFPVEGQKAMLREVTKRIGFDYGRGRIDVSLHPFCSGCGDDIRMTTRFKEDEPLDSLFSAIHETGHGLYEQGLPGEFAGTALGIHAGMAVHESQSRLWENQVARGRGFWRFFEPRFRALFPAQTAGVGSEDLYLAINEVSPTSIRVDADEVTYNLHVILRFEVERRLFSGEVRVADLPRVWRELSRELLGLKPESDSRGVLQDVHWSGGAFGYFPSYTIGNMIAAQLWYRVLEEKPGIEEEFARGEFGWLLGWLRRNVHSQGRRHDALTLVRTVTGAELSPAPLVRYLRERYGPLYL
jgi:carboxypeptidase Taq